ncbi:ead/Ea22-like family protein [Citrobacter portucalensis]|uniref:ead/Ea22-like family protein n=1 Tax=Citrobacter portucalensis TaxID=1639133 RepID=UPI002FE53CC3
MPALNKQALRERYSSQPVPKCHICGAEMTIQRAGGGSLVYGCTGRVDSDGEGYVFAEGRDFADNHYALSRVTVANNSDPDVLAMLDELEAAEKRIAELEARQGKPIMFIDGDISSSDAEKLAAVIREWDDAPAPAIQEEMEVREVVVKQFDDFQIVHYGGSEDYAKGYIDCQNNYNKALTGAGIGVKGD